MKRMASNYFTHSTRSVLKFCTINAKNKSYLWIRFLFTYRNDSLSICTGKWGLDEFIFSNDLADNDKQLYWPYRLSSGQPDYRQRMGFACQQMGFVLCLSYPCWRTVPRGSGGRGGFVIHTDQWRIQDFPQGGRQLPKVLLFFNFLPKTAWKWKNLDPQGGARVPGAPPWIRQCRSTNLQITGTVTGGKYERRTRVPLLVFECHYWLVTACIRRTECCICLSLYWGPHVISHCLLSQGCSNFFAWGSPPDLFTLVYTSLFNV